MKKQDYHLPKDLAERLSKAQALGARERVSWSIWSVFLVFMVGLLLIYTSDRLWDTAGELRFLLLLLLSGLLVHFVYLACKAVRAFLSGPESTVQLIEEKFPKLGDSLQGAVELSHEESRPADISPELCEAAINQVAEAVKDCDFCSAIPTKESRKRGFLCLISLSLLGVLAWIDVAALKSSAKRWAMPFGETPRYTFMQFEKLPETLTVLHGEAFSVELILNKDSSYKADSVTYKFRGSLNQRNSSLLGGDKVLLNFKGIHKNSVLSLSCFDWQKDIQLKVVHRPSLLKLEADIDFPTYTQVGREVHRVNSGRIQVLQGSKLSLRGELSNEIQNAYMSDGNEQELHVEGKNFKTSIESLDQLEDVTKQVYWRDTYGNTGQDVYELKIQMIEDKAPEVDFLNTLSSMAILRSDSILLPIVAKDSDYGVKEVSLDWSMQNTSEESRGIKKQFKRNLLTLDSGLKEVQTHWLFSPEKLNVPVGYRVLIKAGVKDFKPGRDVVKSRELTVYVISEEEHEKIVRRRLEMLQAKLNELASDEVKQLERVKKLKLSLSEALKKGDLDALDKLGEELRKIQNINKNQAKKLAKTFAEAEKLLKEALKNESFNKDELASWLKSLGKLDEAQKNQVNKVSKTLKELADKMRQEKMSRSKQESSMTKNEAGASHQASKGDSAGKAIPMHYDEIKKSAEESEKQEEELVRQLKSLSKETEEDKKDDELHNMARRLFAIHEQEKKIQDELARLLPQLIGYDYDSLSEVLKIEIDKLSEIQKKAIQETNQVTRELRRTYRLTRIDLYGTVLAAMNDAEALERVERLSDLISGIQVGQALKKASSLQKDFEEWSKMLLPEAPKPQQGGGGDGGGQQDQSLLVELIRIIMEEQDIYRETLYVNEHRLTLDLKTEVEGIQVLQSKNLDALDKVNAKISEQEATAILNSGALVMEQAEGSLKQVDLISALEEQAASVEVLIQLFKPKASGSGGQSNSQAATLNMMRRILKDQKNQQAAMKKQGQKGASRGQGKAGAEAGQGANPGGDGEAGNLLGGDADAGAKNSEINEKRRAILSNEIPQEYKSALEEYYRKLEREYED